MKDLNLFRAEDSVYLREIRSKEDLGDLGFDGFLIRSGEKEARRIIASLKDKKFKGRIGLYGGDDAFNRRVIETLKVDYLVSPEVLTGRDTLKQRDSGLNHVVAKMAAEKNIEVVVDMGAISGVGGRELVVGKEKGKRIARIMQNVKVCRKVGCSIKIASLGRKKSEVFDEKGRQSFGVGLGMSSGEIRDCVKF